MEANSEETNQTPRSAASGLVLHCLPMSHKKDARHKWVNDETTILSVISTWFYEDRENIRQFYLQSNNQRHKNQITLLFRQPRVTVTSCFVY